MFLQTVLHYKPHIENINMVTTQTSEVGTQQAIINVQITSFAQGLEVCVVNDSVKCNCTWQCWKSIAMSDTISVADRGML
jgi:hypothetical protein